MRRRAAARGLNSAVVSVALACMIAACGEKEERTPGISRADVRGLVAAGLRAVGSDAPAPEISFSVDGPTLRSRLEALPDRSPVLGLLASFQGVRADIEQFCPKPALLRCRPSLRAAAWPRSRHTAARSVAALRRLVARTYDEPQLVRRRGTATRIVTANGELLAAVRTARGTVMFSFGGLDPPRRTVDTVAGGLKVRAGADALAAMRSDLQPAARRALAGVRRLVVSARLR